MKEVEIKCPNCGATTGQELVANGVFRCRFCETSFVVEGETARAPHPKGAPPPVPSHHASAHRPPKSGDSKAAWMAIGGSVAVMVAVGGIALLVGGGSTQHAHGDSGTSHGSGDRPHDGASAPHLSATFQFERTAPVTDGDVYVYGDVTNTSRVPIGAAKVHVIMKDGSGREVASKSSYTQQDVIEPGQRVPFYAILDHPPHYAKLAFEVVASEPFAAKPAPGLHLEKDPPRVGSYGQWVFSGKVVNGGTATARFVQVEVVARDAQGTMLGIDRSFADGESLAPGASARYEVTSVSYPAHPRPVTFEYWVWGDQK